LTSRSTATHQEPRTPVGAPAPAPPRYAPVTPRAVLLGLVGAALVSAIQVVYKIIPRTVILPFHSALTLFAGAIFLLFVLAVVNAGLRRWRPRWALQPSEFAVIYGLMTVAASIAAQDEAQYLLPMFVFPFRGTQDRTMGPFRPEIARWLAPRDPRVVEPYYLGGGSFWRPDLLLAWAVPLLHWLLWLMVLGATMWAWAVIMRRRWVEHDRLSFPCLQLPLEMCRAGGFGGMLSGRLFWSGLLISTLIESLEQARAWFPNIPAIPLGFPATPVLEAAPAPWNALAPMYLAWSNLHLGICYFIPLDILFSSWFFYFLRKGMEVFGFAMGWRDLGWDAKGFPFTRAQAAGAWAAIFFLLVWADRHHLRRVLLSAFGRGAPPDDAREPGSYRWAGRILVGGTLLLILHAVAAGMSWGLALAFYGFFWILNVTMTRIYAQVGPPILELYFLDPQATLTTVLGTHGHSPRSLTFFSLMYWINRDDRGQPMAHQLSAFRVGEATRTDPRALGKWVLVAFVVGAVTCLLTYLHWAYRVGEDQFVEGAWREAAAPLAVARVNDWVHNPTGPRWREIGFMTFGALFTFALAKASYTIPAFPFHPIGYALAICFAVEYNWPAFLMIWAVKGAVLRYGGRQLYVRLVPFFLGIVLGGFVAPVAWGLVSWLFEWYQ
jgi:hypothetical protein